MKKTLMPEFKSGLAADFFMLYLIADADGSSSSRRLCIYDKKAERAICWAIKECEVVGDKKNAALCRKYHLENMYAKYVQEMRGYTK